MKARCSSENSLSPEPRLSQTLVVLSILHVSDVRVESASVEVGRFVRPCADVHQRGQVREHPRGGHPDSVAVILGFLLGRRLSLMCAAMLVASV